ncbi:hypothetical protein EON79_03955 [bacterium]|nr:MAG: hypothetical protein EON79_03955 [bacterium]
MDPNAPKTVSTPKLERRERRIPLDAKRATDAARQRTLKAGLDVLIIRGKRLVRLMPSGKKEIVGNAPQKVRKEQKTYQLEWSPRLPD